MAAVAHIPGPYAFDPVEGRVAAEVGVIVAEIPGVDAFPCRDTDQDERFEAELAATGHLLAAAPDMLAMARSLVEPFADIDGEFLAECADQSPNNLHLIGGRGLTGHFARAILAARAAIAKAEDR